MLAQSLGFSSNEVGPSGTIFLINLLKSHLHRLLYTLNSGNFELIFTGTNKVKRGSEQFTKLRTAKYVSSNPRAFWVRNIPQIKQFLDKLTKQHNLALPN
jgi:hypothetical protein